MARKRVGRRYRLLYQQRFQEMVFWPAILIVAVTAALILWNPPQVVAYRPLFALALAIAVLVMILTYLYRLRAYVRCRERDLIVQLPFYRLTIPYTEIAKSRPSELYRLFPPSQQRSTENHFLEPLFGATVLVLEIPGLTEPRKRLRLWMPKYMLSPDQPGLVIATRDWISLDTEMEELRARRYFSAEA